MPDFERVFDDLRLDLAETPDDKAYVEGYIDGKKYARKELLILMLFGMSITLSVLILGTSKITLALTLCAILAIFIHFAKRSPVFNLPSKREK